MTITNYHVQNVIRAYGQQINRFRNVKKAQQSEEQNQLDRISISSEAKKRQVIKNIAAEILDRLTNPQNRTDFERSILDKLSEEYGYPLDIQQNENGADITFKVIDEENREVVKSISFNDSKHLQKRLYELTELEVQKNLA